MCYIGTRRELHFLTSLGTKWESALRSPGCQCISGRGARPGPRTAENISCSDASLNIANIQRPSFMVVATGNRAGMVVTL